MQINSLRASAVLLLLICAQFNLVAQYTHKATQKLYTNASLDSEFEQYRVFEIDLSRLRTQLTQESGNAEVHLQMDDLDWRLQLHPSGVVADNYRLSVLTANGIETYPKTYEKAFAGVELNSGGRVRLTIDHDYIGGFVEQGKTTWFIEPVKHFVSSAPAHHFVVYKAADAFKEFDGHQHCEVIHLSAEKGTDDHINLAEAAQSQICLDLQLAIASDNSMFVKYGSVTNVENHNITVMNNVETDFTGKFIHDINFVIVTQFIVTTGSDPWSSTLVAGDFLSSFRNWGNAGGFGAGVTFDLGQIWTNRDFSGSTIGVAYVGGLCSSFKYQALQDFSSSAPLLRCMVSHETGHNFDMEHDGGSGFIMSPSVSTTTTWSAGSTGTFASFVPPRINAGCLVACAGGGGGGGGTAPTASFNFSPSTPCVNQTISLNNTSTGAPTTFSWSMPGGTPSTSSASNPTVTYSTPGLKTVTLTVSNASGTNTTTQNINVTSAVANFTTSVSGVNVSFTYTGSTATAWSWNFGNGATSTQQNPTVTYATPGTYTVSLSITGPCGNASVQQTITTGPLASFSSNTQSGCAPLTVQFTDQSIGATSWSWQFQGGSPTSSNQRNPVVTFSNPGAFDVSLLVSNGSGTSTDFRNDYINIALPPTATFTTSPSGATVSFLNTSQNGSTYLWNFGDGITSTLFSPTHTYASQGSYVVSLTVTNSCGSTTTSQPVLAIVAPVASFTFMQQPNSCAPVSVQFNSTSTGGGLSYSWSFPGGNPSSSTDPNPLVIYPAQGTYSVSLLASNAAGGNSTQQNVLVTAGAPPTATFTASVNGTSCTVSNTTVGATGYLWNFGDGTTSNEVNPTHTYTSAGTYVISLVVTNACGTSQPATATVTVVLPPVAVINASQTVGCAPLTIQYSGTAGSGISHQWSFPGGNPGTSTDANPIVAYGAPGTFNTQYTATNSAGSASATKTITLGSGASPAFTAAVAGANVTFTNQSVGATSYLWNFGNGQTSTDFSPAYTYPQNGTYTVTLSATNNCGTTTATQSVTIVTPPTAGFTASATSGCAPFTVLFTNTSSANATGFNWNFGNGTSVATSPNAQTTFDVPGTYTVTLTTSNAAGTSSSTTIITVGNKPSPSFTPSVQGSQVSFTNSSVDASGYFWNFGDGNTSSALNPTHTYLSDGIYTVTLTASNSCGSSTTTRTVTIITPPAAAFGAVATTGCAPFTVQFNQTASSNTTGFQWAFPGGTPSTSTEPNPVITYTTAGTYTVALTATNAAGQNTRNQMNYIVVLPQPTATFTANTNGAVTTLTNTSINANSYTWAFGDGSSSTLQNPTHTYSADGTYTVTLTASNSCGSVTATQSITIITPPTANFVPGTTSGCAPLTTSFSNLSSTNATSYFWSFVGGTPATSTEPNPTVVWNTPGTHIVTLAASNSAGSNTTMQTIMVSTVPTTSFQATLGGLTISCNNLTTGATTYLWDFGDGNTSTQPNPSHTYATTGTYTVTLIATNTCGSNTSSQMVPIIGSAPAPGFTASQTTACVQNAIQYTDQSVGNPTAWLWSFEGGTPSTSTAQNPSVSYATPGVYNVTLTTTNVYGSNTTVFTDTITIEQQPVAGFTSQANIAVVKFTNSSQNGTSYLWNFGDGATSTNVSPTHTYATSGTYLVTLIASNSCGSSQIQQPITVNIVNTEFPPAWVSKLLIYPVPANQEFTVVMEAPPIPQVEMVLFDLLGRQVNHQITDFTSGTCRVTFDVADLESAPYFLKIMHAGKSVVTKIVVMK